MAEGRIPEWDIPNAFGPPKLTDLEKDALLRGVNKALRLLTVGGGPLNHVAGCYAEAIDLENNRRIGYAGKAKRDRRPICLLCHGSGYLEHLPIK